MTVVLPLGATSIRLRGEVPPSVVERIRPFVALPSGDGIELEVVRGEPTPASRSAVQADVHGIWRLSEEGSGLAVFLRESSTEQPILHAQFDGRDGVVRVSKRLRDSEVVAPFVTILLQALAVRLLADGGGLLVHASGVARDRAVLFLGQSGAGKTTTARNCSAFSTAFSDDRAVVYLDGEGMPRAMSTPFQQRLETAPADHALGALCWLRKAGTERLRPMQGALAAARLAACCFLPLWDKGRLENALGTLQRVREAASVLELEVPNSPTFGHLLEPWLTVGPP